MNTFIDSDIDSISLTRKHLWASLLFPICAVGLIWFAHILRIYLDLDAGDYGVISRTVYGLRGIVTAPLVHGSLGHIASNTVPLLVLAALTFYFYQRVALRAFWLIYFLTGILVWLFARQVSHIGASGVVYGLVAFIFWNGITRGSVRSIILSLVVLFFYSGMFMGILPNEAGVSWESHLLGSFSGIIAAFWFKSELEDEEKTNRDPFAEERGIPRQRFLPAGIFDKTKLQREQEAAEEARRIAEAYYWEQQQQIPPPPFWNQTGTW